jgi:hypothetical protein
MWQKIIVGIVVLLLAAPGMVQAIDDTAAPKQIDRARLSHSFRNTGTQGGLYDPGSQAYGGRASGSMHYPFVFTGDQDRGFGRDLDSDNSRGEGVWMLAKDASGRVRITASGPVFITEDVEAIVPELTPGGNLKMISGDHPFVKAKMGYETKDSNAWHMADGGAPPQMRPLRRSRLSSPTTGRTGIIRSPLSTTSRKRSSSTSGRAMEAETARG